MTNFHAAIQSMLRCPRCPTENHAGVAPLIELSPNLHRAMCNVCSFEGLVAEFLPDAASTQEIH